MKKLLPLLFGGLIALTLFVSTGNTAKAAECGCAVTPILGAERNKLVADLINSEEFKNIKKELQKEELSWSGADTIEVIKFNISGEILIAVPFLDANGSGFMYVFYNGKFVYYTPL
ncbi:hypothetical protein PH210_08625 [Paenibacillus sp. BSR1-1]|uniref:hypothetical protein n=1 Tax=Paenibacillus sp. BSR1-1 TaxID=3020845 RepID=UPI0025B02024|nr:hypothetical protein [Paenibacillus sp. BSR1-1]MDN3016262.1 hypothetical protein [Paenibacillus sp. BSR1-1]